MPRKNLEAIAFTGTVSTLDNNNSRVESLNRQPKKNTQKRQLAYMYKVFQWNALTSTRRTVEETIIASRCCTRSASRRLLPLINLLNPFAQTKVLLELKKMRFVNIEYEIGDWLFMIDCDKHYEVDAGTCECNCRTFMFRRYPCRHLLLAYVKRRTLTAHHILRPCSRWKINSTHNFHYNTTSLPRRSEEYIRIQRTQKILKQQIVEKYGEHFAIMVEKKVSNFYLRIISN
ncbi:LOW QUALITY PROTEIN: hypothetical protein Smp_076710.1 [Schistosoma mansoni]|uniref:hypothetical protein n=1 Tax=Schistosoma mansoni TaxID=6183 RepID=UPI00022DC8FB|nr:LOW QUALITY PROTEIN: hypothetical protein Smp_076710.1 [Schistosoma mansoni]|eukprot:XP_018647799.1 LOW QUALITY PROTEIN: hypothetical protein Smp_076710.1 [Schistosoma mansoni]